MVIFSDMASQSKLIEELSSVIKYVRVSLLSSYNFNANVVIQGKNEPTLLRYSLNVTLKYYA